MLIPHFFICIKKFFPPKEERLGKEFSHLRFTILYCIATLLSWWEPSIDIRLDALGEGKEKKENSGYLHMMLDKLLLITAMILLSLVKNYKKKEIFAIEVKFIWWNISFVHSICSCLLCFGSSIWSFSCALHIHFPFIPFD